MKSGKHMMLLVGVLMSTVIGANLFLLFAATGDPSFAIEENYYQKALAWDRLQAEQAKSDELGWWTTVEVDRNGLVVNLFDREGRAIEGAQVGLEAFANARAADRFTDQLREEALGRYRWNRGDLRRGLWELRLSAERGTDRYLEKRSVEIR